MPGCRRGHHAANLRVWMKLKDCYTHPPFRYMVLKFAQYIEHTYTYTLFQRRFGFGCLADCGGQLDLLERLEGWSCFVSMATAFSVWGVAFWVLGAGIKDCLSPESAGARDVPELQLGKNSKASCKAGTGIGGCILAPQMHWTSGLGQRCWISRPRCLIARNAGGVLNGSKVTA